MDSNFWLSKFMLFLQILLKYVFVYYLLQLSSSILSADISRKLSKALLKVVQIEYERKGTKTRALKNITMNICLAGNVHVSCLTRAKNANRNLNHRERPRSVGGTLVCMVPNVFLPLQRWSEPFSKNLDL